MRGCGLVLLSIILNSIQKCVKERASKSIQCVRDMSEAEAMAAVETVFHTCFTDTDPFERVPP